jgi:RNA polymerase sigma factor (sigma-70 family)
MSSRSLAFGNMAIVDRDEAVRALVAERLEPSYNLARMLVRDRALAEEATHDAVVRALGSSRQLRDPDAFDGWFRRILVNSCRDVLRRRGDRPAPIVAVPPQMVPDLAAGWVERDAMGEALARLSDEHREVVVLRYYADLPVDAIAQSLGIRAGTVKSRLHRALSRLRAEYDAASRPSKELSR